uniref:ADP-ribosylation factor n=1 Tax=Mycena chlorophos TaxID=658473 RepID=A0ABQ0LLL0_MYCCL|nr:ADP-ribosylation factor [Mycena chlorophos]
MSTNNIVTRLIERFFPSGQGHRAVLLGASGSGKTTLLYRIKIGEIVTTIPTIGFNVEDVKVPTGPRGSGPLGLLCWDVGGCGRDHLLALSARQTAWSDVIIWLVDSDTGTTNSDEWFQYGLDEFTKIMKRVDEDPASAAKERPILVLATKQDVKNHLSLDEVRKRVVPVLAGRQWFAVGLTLTTSLTDGPLIDAFAWLQATLAGRTLKPVPEESQQHNSPAPTPSPIESWLTRADIDSPDSVFLEQFENLSLPAWDHYTHVRLAFLILTRHGRQAGKDRLFSGLESYIARAPRSQTNGRTFHLTMTYFWLQLVHFGIQSTPPQARGLDDGGDWLRFLLVNPFVADGGLWQQYYSKDVMMSPKAKTEMVLPDLKPLPSLVVRDALEKAR